MAAGWEKEGKVGNEEDGKEEHGWAETDILRGRLEEEGVCEEGRNRVMEWPSWVGAPSSSIGLIDGLQLDIDV